MRVTRLVLVLFMLIGAVGWAQSVPPPKLAPAVPTLSEADTLKITNYLLQSENIALKIQALQTEQAKMQAEFKEYMRTLDRPGFHIGQAGIEGNMKFIYVADPPKVEKK